MFHKGEKPQDETAASTAQFSGETKGQKKRKMLKLDSTQMFSPIRDVRDGIVVTKDRRYIKSWSSRL